MYLIYLLLKSEKNSVDLFDNVDLSGLFNISEVLRWSEGKTRV